jgi:hypothetical protein
MFEEISEKVQKSRRLWQRVKVFQRPLEEKKQ